MVTWWALTNRRDETLPVLHVVKPRSIGHDGARTACGMRVWGARPVDGSSEPHCRRCDKSAK